jgi:hypothetical protein
MFYKVTHLDSIESRVFFNDHVQYIMTTKCSARTPLGPKMPFIVATYVYASSQGQRTHTARTNVLYSSQLQILTDNFQVQNSYCQIFSDLTIWTRHDNLELQIGQSCSNSSVARSINCKTALPWHR